MKISLHRAVIRKIEKEMERLDAETLYSRDPEHGAYHDGRREGALDALSFVLGLLTRPQR